MLSSRRAPALLAAIAMAAAACSPAATTTSTTEAVTSTSSTAAPTTSTLPAFSIEGAPEELAGVIEQFYAYTTGNSNQAPPMPGAVAAVSPVERETPTEGVASVGTFREQQVATVEMGEDLFLAVDDGSGWRIVGGSWPDLDLQWFGEFPRLVAVIGSDARPGENQERSRGDSLHVVGLDGTGAGGIVGIPRDSYVAIPGVGNDKINAALSRGGPDTLVRAMEQVSGLEFEGYVLTGFEGFMVMAGEVLGGVEMEIPFDISDDAAGAFFKAGRQYVNGVNALALARVRKSVSGGDFTRSRLQGEILLAAVEIVKIKGFGAIPVLMEGSDPWLSTNLTPEQILTFAAAAVSADLESIPNVVVPGRGGSVNGASVVHLSDDGKAIWADLADGSLEPR